MMEASMESRKVLWALTAMSAVAVGLNVTSAVMGNRSLARVAWTALAATTLGVNLGWLDAERR